MQDKELIDSMSEKSMLEEILQLDGLEFNVLGDGLTHLNSGKYTALIVHPIIFIEREPNTFVAIFKRNSEDNLSEQFEYQVSLQGANFLGNITDGMGTVDIESSKNYAVSKPYRLVPEVGRKAVELSLEWTHSRMSRYQQKSALAPVFPNRKSITENPLVSEIENRLSDTDENKRRLEINRMAQMIMNPSESKDNLAEMVRNLDPQVPAAALYLYLMMGHYKSRYANPLYKEIGAYAKRSGIWTPS